MQVPLTVLGHVDGARADVLVTVEEGDTVRDVAVALAGAARRDGGAATGGVVRPLRPAAGNGGGAGLWADGRRLADDLPAGAVLRDGMVVALDPRDGPATGLAEPSGVVEVRVAGGPAAGPVHRLGLGRFELGADPECAVALADPAVPPRAAVVEVRPGGVLVEPAAGAELALDGDPVEGRVPWPEGGVLAVGATLLGLHRPEPADASLTPTEDGGLAYNRPPRLLPPRRARRLVVPQEPRRGEGPRFGLLVAVLPAVFGAAMAWLLRQPLYLAMALLGPLTVLASFVSEKRGGRKRHRTAMKEYQEARRRHEAELEELRAADEAERRQAAPDPASLLLVATGPRRRLWERRGDDPDALHLRVGAADLPAAVQLDLPRDAAGGEPPPPPPARNVPVLLDLRELGVVGVAGGRQAARGLARWLVAQAAVLHSPRDLQVVLLAPDPEGSGAWGWLRWLPHARGDGQDCVARVGNDPETVARRVAELADEVTRRRAEWTGVGRQRGHEPHVLVVLDGARALRRVPGMPQVLGEGPPVGVTAVCLDDDERLLPEECRTVATFLWDDPARLRLRGGGLDAVGPVLADQVGAAWCERVARAMAPVRDVSRDDAGGMLPDSARLLDLHGMPDPDPELVAVAWARDGRGTAAPLGYGRDGPFTLDLRRDGPHALVAGTTGSGKSELLQSLIASLALANRPDAMNFVLIDYKGGSAFKDCARLPHTVGMVTDLDGHLTQRALASLSAELKRREELLLRAGAKDIEDYWAERRRRGADALEPLPRLVLVIDEFASLVAELPEFVAGLVGIAQRGRSLGVHLVLATQRPAGVVSADIRANTNLRIALRVTDAAESADVIDAPDAAAIARSTPGRCYVRAGASTLVAVQTARVGGRRPGARVERAGPRVARVGWGDLGRPLPAAAAAAEDDDAATDLSVLVEAINRAAARGGGWTRRSPWLPPLPEVVTLAELPRAAGDPPAARRPPAAGGPSTAGPEGSGAPVAFGLVDVPAEQRRRALAFDLAGGGHLLVAGSPRSGRSTALRSLAGAVAAATSPADVHLYALDCGGNALLPLVGLPHCGAVVGRDQPDRVDRLLGRLLAEVARRQQLLAEQGASSLAEQRAAAAPGERLPWMLLLLDRWEGFVAAFEDYDLGRLVDAVLRLLREGPAVGLRAVVTSDASGLVGQVSTVFEERLLLRFADADDWSRAGVPAREVPGAMPPGRGLLATTHGLLEAQVGLLDPDPSGPAQVAALQRLARTAAGPIQGGGPPRGPPPPPPPPPGGRGPPPPGGRPPRRGTNPGGTPWGSPGPPRPAAVALARAQRPMRVDALPLRVTAAEALALDPELVPASPLWALLGAGGDALGPVGVDLLQTSPGFVVGGPPRSGRSTVLETMARSLAGRGVPVVLVTPRRSPLRELAVPGVLGVVAGDDDAELLAKLLDGVERHVVLVDDAELLLDTALDDALGKLVRAARDADQAVVAAGTTADLASQYRGFVVDVRRSRSGLLLSPQTAADGDLLGVRLPRNMAAGPLGRGLLVVNGAVTPVQAAVGDR